MSAGVGLAGPAALFLNYLEDLPLRAWLDAVGTPQVFRRRDPSAEALAWALAAMDPNAVFEVRSGVLHALARFETAEGRRLSDGRVATRRLRPLTERAALAVLARDRLKADEFAMLYAPFSIVIPPVLLFGIG